MLHTVVQLSLQLSVLTHSSQWWHREVYKDLSVTQTSAGASAAITSVHSLDSCLSTWKWLTLWVFQKFLLLKSSWDHWQILRLFYSAAATPCLHCKPTYLPDPLKALKLLLSIWTVSLKTLKLFRKPVNHCSVCRSRGSHVPERCK